MPDLGKRARAHGGSRPSTPELTRASTPTDISNGPESPPAKRPKTIIYENRFVGDRADDVRSQYYLLDDHEGGSKHRMMPAESDAVKEQANQLFTTILHNEINPGTSIPPSPARGGGHNSPSAPSTPTRNRILHRGSESPYATPSRGTPRMDAPEHQLSPIHAQSRLAIESVRGEPRTISKTPFRVLDAPELADDFYLSELSWSEKNVLAVGLGSCVYLWHADSADVHKLCDYSATDSVSSVCWQPNSSKIAVGTQSGVVHLWDVAAGKLEKTWADHTERVGTLTWEKDYLASGSRDRVIMLNDIRGSERRPTMRLAGHRQEVCGLAYNSSNGYLASGGNDNKVLVWDIRHGRPNPHDVTGQQTVPLWKFHEHTAAVKALAWNPHMPHCLATGGGTQDKFLRFWNSATGTLQNEYDTGSQVCALMWSKTTHELVSSHGFSATAAQNQILVFRYPSLSMVASLQGHTSRVLYLAMSPDGETIVSGAGDETLRFWTVFPKIAEPSNSKKSDSPLRVGKQIR